MYSDNMYSFGDIDRILNSGAAAADLLLFGEWPNLCKSIFSDEEEGWIAGEKYPMQWKLASLLSSFSARYIFCSHANKMYKREPFVTDAGFVCRFIALRSCSEYNVNHFLRELFMGLSLVPLHLSS